jgi:hypothetical protein
MSSTAKLTPKMMEALDAAYANGSHGVTYLPAFKSSTLNALIERGLIVMTACHGYRITDAGRTWCSPRETTSPEQDTRVTIVEVAEELAYAWQRGLDNYAADYRAQINPSLLSEISADALGSTVVEEDPEYLKVCQHGYHSDYCTTCHPTAASVVAELTEAMERRGLTPEQVTEDLDRLVTSPAGRAAAFGKPVKLYDRIADQKMTVLGTTPDGLGVLFRFEDEAPDGATRVSATTLDINPMGRYVALCDHGYTAHDSCPNCDATHDDHADLISNHGVEVSVHTFSGHTIDLGMIYNNADTTWSAMTPEGVVLGTAVSTSDSAVRALTLDHKIRVWRTAVNENITRDEAKALDEHAAYHVELRKSQQIEAAVRTLIEHGVTTPREFLQHVEQVLKLDGAQSELEAEQLGKPTPVRNTIRLDELIVGPADVWNPPIAVPPMAYPTMSAAEAFSVIDFSEYPPSVPLTKEQTIPDPTGAVRKWLLGSPHVTPVSDPTQSAL